jgi:hypothetical protein
MWEPDGRRIRDIPDSEIAEYDDMARADFSKLMSAIVSADLPPGTPQEGTRHGHPIVKAEPINYVALIYSHVMNFDYDGETPLALACRIGSAQTVEALMHKDAYEVKIDRQRSTCFIAAALNENEDHAVDITKFLLRKYRKRSMVVIETADHAHGTALDVAIRTGKFKLTKLLIKRKPNKHFHRALSTAAAHSLKMVQTLLDTGVVITGERGAISLHNAINSGQHGILDALLKSRENWGRAEEDHSLLLYAARQKGYADVIRVFLDRITQDDAKLQAMSRKRKRPPPGAFKDEYVDDEDE